MLELSKCTVPVVDDITEAFDEKKQIFSTERLKGLGEIVVEVFIYIFSVHACCSVLIR
jgi:hypothetical protein